MVAVDAAMLAVVLRGVRLHLASGSEWAEIMRRWTRGLVSALVRRVASKQVLP
jgi:hypothetical protein